MPHKTLTRSIEIVYSPLGNVAIFRRWLETSDTMKVYKIALFNKSDHFFTRLDDTARSAKKMSIATWRDSIRVYAHFWKAVEVKS